MTTIGLPSGPRAGRVALAQRRDPATSYERPSMRAPRSSPNLRAATYTTDPPPVPSVLDRMHKSGWVNVRSNSLDEEQGRSSPELERRGSADSGYGSLRAASPSKGGYLASLKTAVWGEEASGVPAETVPVSSTPANHLWNRIISSTHAVSASVADAVHRARGDGEDDDSVGPDGETKLGRAIKEYHISRADSSKDLPKWLFSPAELAARSASNAARATSRTTADIEDRLTRPARSYTVARPAREQDAQIAGHRRTDSAGSSGFPSSGSRATDKLRAMREAKRVAML